MTPKALRSLRISMGFTVEEFAALLEVKPADLQAWEAGDKPFDPARLQKEIAAFTPKPPRTASAG